AFQGPALATGAIDAAPLARAGLAGVDTLIDLTGDVAGFLVFVVRHITHDARTRAQIGPQVLHPAPLVAGDHGVGRGQDGLGRAVVLLQQDGAGLGVVGFELGDVADVRAAEGVD